MGLIVKEVSYLKAELAYLKMEIRKDCFKNPKIVDRSKIEFDVRRQGLQSLTALGNLGIIYFPSWTVLKGQIPHLMDNKSDTCGILESAGVPHGIRLLPSDRILKHLRVNMFYIRVNLRGESTKTTHLRVSAGHFTDIAPADNQTQDCFWIGASRDGFHTYQCHKFLKRHPLRFWIPYEGESATVCEIEMHGHL